MLFERSEIAELVKRVAKSPVERIATQQMSFLLLDPIAPVLLCEVLKALPELASPNHCFPKHLAFGVVDYSLEYRNDGDRFQLARRLFRQLESISFHAPEHPVLQDLSRQVSTKYWDLYRGYLSAQELLRTEELSAFELSAHVEQFLLAIIDQAQLLLLILEYRLRFSKHPGRAAFLERLGRAVESGFVTEALNEDALVLQADQSIRFSRSSRDNPQFLSTAANAVQRLKNL